MSTRDRTLITRLTRSLDEFESNVRRLPGLRAQNSRNCYVLQLVDSIHRVNYVRLVASRDVSPRRSDPRDELFDPLKAAIWHFRGGDLDEAFWLLFLFVHFGKHRRGGWRYLSEVYGRRGGPDLWSWAAVSSNLPGFTSWLKANYLLIQNSPSPGGFGNHRKRESLSDSWTGETIRSYVRWIVGAGGHRNRLLVAANEDPRVAFDRLYRAMAPVYRFGRTARFDYLTMLGKTGFLPIEPGSAYLSGSTGPIHGARLLFGSRMPPPTLDQWLVELSDSLGVGLQVMEDSLCNWQKSPKTFKSFRG